MDAMTAVKRGWARILKGFYSWLREVKNFDLPDSEDSLVDEWIELQLDRMGSALSVVAEIIGRGSSATADDPDEEPLR